MTRDADRKATITALLQQPRTIDTWGDELLATIEALRPQTPPDVARAIANLASGRKRKGNDRGTA